MRVVLDLLTESICQSGKAAHVHPRCKVLALHERCAHMLGIRIPAHHFHVTADALGRRYATSYPSHWTNSAKLQFRNSPRELPELRWRR
jgi:hypothetical protein